MQPTASPQTIRRSPVVRRWLLAVGLALGVVASAGTMIAPARAEAATFGNIFVVATAHFSCGSHTITVWPMTNEPLDGQFGVYTYAQVFDRISGRWITTNWLLGNGTQGHVFYNMRSFDPCAKVTYARYMYGTWVYKADWNQITDDLDNMGVFCNP